MSLEPENLDNLRLGTSSGLRKDPTPQSFAATYLIATKKVSRFGWCRLGCTLMGLPLWGVWPRAIKVHALKSSGTLVASIHPPFFEKDTTCVLSFLEF